MHWSVLCVYGKVEEWVISSLIEPYKTYFTGIYKNSVPYKTRFQVMLTYCVKDYLIQLKELNYFRIQSKINDY